MTMVSEKRMVAERIPAYTYGTAEAAKSPISLKELEELKQSVSFTSDDEKYLKLAGEVLADQTKELVDAWRGVISKAPHLAKQWCKSLLLQTALWAQPYTDPNLAPNQW